VNSFSVDVLGAIFAGALAEVISTVSGISPGVLSSDRDADFDDIIGLMSLNGAKSGIVFISAGEADMRLLCSRMTGVPKEDVTKADMDDALGEIVNMTAGNAKLRFSDAEYMFTLSLPFVISGKGMSIGAKKNSHVITKRLGNGEITLKLKVVY